MPVLIYTTPPFFIVPRVFANTNVFAPQLYEFCLINDIDISISCMADLLSMCVKKLLLNELICVYVILEKFPNPK
jgi:hypothetical protein